MCNGWSNRETWLVNLWFNPGSKADLEYVREHLEEELDKIESGVLKDMIDLGAINWRELEEACCEYEEEDEEQP